MRLRPEIHRDPESGELFVRFTSLATPSGAIPTGQRASGARAAAGDPAAVLPARTGIDALLHADHHRQDRRITFVRARIAISRSRRLGGDACRCRHGVFDFDLRYARAAGSGDSRAAKGERAEDFRQRCIAARPGRGSAVVVGGGHYAPAGSTGSGNPPAARQRDPASYPCALKATPPAPHHRARRPGQGGPAFRTRGTAAGGAGRRDPPGSQQAPARVAPGSPAKIVPGGGAEARGPRRAAVTMPLASEAEQHATICRPELPLTFCWQLVRMLGHFHAYRPSGQVAGHARAARVAHRSDRYDYT